MRIICQMLTLSRLRGSSIASTSCCIQGGGCEWNMRCSHATRCRVRLSGPTATDYADQRRLLRIIIVEDAQESYAPYGIGEGIDLGVLSVLLVALCRGWCTSNPLRVQSDGAQKHSIQTEQSRWSSIVGGTPQQQSPSMLFLPGITSKKRCLSELPDLLFDCAAAYFATRWGRVALACSRASWWSSTTPIQEEK
jgi:hypothetical protein